VGLSVAKLQLLPDEVVLRRASTAYLKARLKLVPGEALVTQRRFVHVGQLRATAAAGVLGLLAGGRVDVDVALTTLARLDRSRHGRGQAWTLTTTTGEEYKLLGDLDDWRPAFEDALSRGGRRLVEQQAGSWDVVPA
jgi:hypothetical protein